MLKRLLPVSLAAIAVLGSPVAAQDARPERIAIEYGAPKDPLHAPVREDLKRLRALETVRDLFAPLRLPQTLTIRTMGCDGEENAWFDDDGVTVCYEYVERIASVARSPRRPAWVSEENAILGQFLEVVFHEMAHAIFHVLQVPVLGREEDAADQMATLWLIALKPETADQMLAGVVAGHLDEAGYRSLKHLKRKRFRFGSARPLADVHSTPEQRLYNLLCIAYGADPARFGVLKDRGTLPDERKEGCGEEYRQVVHAYARLIQPHLDPEIARRAFGPNWPILR
jgi:hypothetical protein